MIAAQYESPTLARVLGFFGWLLLLLLAAGGVFLALEHRSGRLVAMWQPATAAALLLLFMTLATFAAGHLVDLAARGNFESRQLLERLQKIEQATDFARRETSTSAVATAELLQEMKAWRAISEKNEGKMLVFLHNLDSRAEHANNLLEWLGKARRPSTGVPSAESLEEPRVRDLPT